MDPETSTNPNHSLTYMPERTLWLPPAIDKRCDFVQGLVQIARAGDPIYREGVAYYLLTAGKDMSAHQAYSTSDGDLLLGKLPHSFTCNTSHICLAPQLGTLDIRTELGRLRVRPYEIIVIPRGVRFNVSLPDGPVRAYGVEIFGGHFDLPNLGVIGSCGLANARDFEVPTANVQTSNEVMEVTTKFAGRHYRASYPGSIFNVAGWHGTSYPYKYDLGEHYTDNFETLGLYLTFVLPGKFNTIGSISYDHPVRLVDSCDMFRQS